MKITEIIQQLQKVLAEHGDLVCAAENGLDPSDPCIVESVVVKENGPSSLDDFEGKKYAYFDAL